MVTELERKVSEALVALGDTPDVIADRLRQLGVKGCRQLYWCCPIATYVRRLTAAARVSAMACGILFYTPEDDNAIGGCVDPSHAVKAFMTRFDGGAYNDLSCMACDLPDENTVGPF